MIDIAREELLSLTQATKLKEWPRRRSGRKINVSTLYRWSTRGCRGVLLETVQVGCTRCTTVGAIQRFIQQLSCPQQRKVAASHSGSTSRSRRGSEIRQQRLNRELDQKGL